MDGGTAIITTELQTLANGGDFLWLQRPNTFSVPEPATLALLGLGLAGLGVLRRKA